MKNAIRSLTAALAGILVMISSWTASADDIDIYSGGSVVNGGAPNVLFLVDNTANWNSVYSAEKNALVTAFTQLAAPGSGDVARFRMGLMLFTETGSPNSTIDGGYVRYHLRDMTAVNGATLAGIVSGLDILNDKSNGGKLGLTMAEAFYYFSGRTAVSGNNKVKADPAAFTSDSTSGPTYRSPVVNGCQRNFIIYISNGPAQDNASDTSTAATALSNAGGSTTTVKISPNDSESNIGDEWARFLGATDLSASLPDKQSATVFTVDVLPGSTGQGPGWSALLKSVAKQSGGEYFAITDAADVEGGLVRALSEILMLVQAQNSVFTSASLPVSVQAQGTYLNQIYIGMFRPDGKSKPRWLGNLKQYKVARDAATGTIFLADAAGRQAILSSTGFISPLATSFWTEKESTPVDGYWAGMPYGDGGSGGGFNLPDGDIVEKGGAAQILRQQFATGRNVFTCYPSCASGMAMQSFDTSNSNLVDYFKPGTPIALDRLERYNSTDTAAARTVANHGLSVGDQITISNVDVSDPTPDPDPDVAGADYANYNGTYIVTKINSSTEFEYKVLTSPTSPATGSITVVKGGAGVPHAGVSITYDAAAGKAVAVLANHGVLSGQTVVISGASPGAYNGTYVVTRVDASTFTYVPTLSVVESPAAVNSAPNAAMSCTAGTTQNHTLAQIFRPAGVANKTVFAVTVDNSTNGTNKCQAGASVSISGVTGYSGSYVIKACPAYAGAYATAPNVNNKTFCFDVSVATAPVAPASPATGSIVASYNQGHQVASLTRVTALATVVTADNHGLNAGDPIIVSGTNESEWSVPVTPPFTVYTVIDSKTFTYRLGYQRPALNPPTARLDGSLSGGKKATVVKGNSVAADDLISWVRGHDVQDEYAAYAASAGNRTEVRPSIHADILHSRPVVIDYGTKKDAAGNPIGQVAFYGTNGGTFHAVTAGQNDPAVATDDAVAFGKEKWSFIADETYDKLQRQYLNSPAIRYFSTPSGVSPPPLQRDYFIDGSIGAYQVPDQSKVYVFLSARRGGAFVYAIDVTDPDNPKFLWRVNDATSGFEKLAQTWSTPLIATVKGNANPVLIFGAGYDASEEDKAPGALRNVTKGHGVFIVDAFTGALVRFLDPWAGTDPAAVRRYSIASDVRIVDTDFDGYADRLYVGDTGANVWRMDVDDADPSNWKVFKLAELGRESYNSIDVTNDRKILFPPEVVLTQTHAAVMVTTGNREYPIDIVGMRPGVVTVVNRAYMLKDTFTGKDATGMVAIKHSTPNAASPKNTKVTATKNTTVFAEEIVSGDNVRELGTSMDALAMSDGINDLDLADRKGWALTLPGEGEKGVNAPLSISGVVFFGSNRPTAPNPNSCNANLGVACGYAVDILKGRAAFDRNSDGTRELCSVFVGGGFPPSPVTGVVNVDGVPTRIIIGAGLIGDGSAIDSSDPSKTRQGSALDTSALGSITTGPRKRTFWYMLSD